MTTITRETQVAALCAVICFILVVLTSPSTAGNKTMVEYPSFTLALHDPQELAKWRVVNDTVMGGVSNSSVSVTEKGMLFSGQLSLENNGGFVSVRRFGQEIELTDRHSLNLTVVGDGRTYQLRLRTRWMNDTVAYAASFATEQGKVVTVSFTPQNFTPVWRGRTVQGAPELVFADVVQPGLMLADKTAGNFRLEVLSLSQHP